jgi:hypothetical protein
MPDTIEEYAADYVHRGLTPGGQAAPGPRDFNEDPVARISPVAV